MKGTTKKLISMLLVFALALTAMSAVGFTAAEAQDTQPEETVVTEKEDLAPVAVEPTEAPTEAPTEKPEKKEEAKEAVSGEVLDTAWAKNPVVWILAAAVRVAGCVAAWLLKKK